MLNSVSTLLTFLCQNRNTAHMMKWLFLPDINISEHFTCFFHFVLFTLVINKEKKIDEFYFRHKSILKKIVCNYLVAMGCLSQWLGVSKHMLPVRYFATTNPLCAS